MAGWCYCDRTNLNFLIRLGILIKDFIIKKKILDPDDLLVSLTKHSNKHLTECTFKNPKWNIGKPNLAMRQKSYDHIAIILRKTGWISGNSLNLSIKIIWSIDADKIYLLFRIKSIPNQKQKGISPT